MIEPSINLCEAPANSSGHRSCCGIRIVIPAFGAAERLRICLDSLRRYCPPDVSILIADDATPDCSVRAVCADFEEDPRFSYIRNDVNRGFVSTCNWACRHYRLPGEDLLLLNSDTEVTDGFLSEMWDVLYLHEKHGLVTPRSNNATIYSVPVDRPGSDANESYAMWQQIKPLLPRFQVMPTAVGFCMLIKAEVLDNFGLFDEIYSPGYNEENDFACRVNRYGYSSIAANWAYVFHYETSSFGPRRAALEEKNREILISRFPEYPRKVKKYLAFDVDPIEHFAELWLPHAPRVFFDLFSLHSAYNGTAEFALNLLRELTSVLDGVCELYIGIGGEARRFFCKELSGHRFYSGDPTNPATVFDLAFKPSQLFEWADFQRMNRFAPRLAFTMLDIIAVRCEYLNSASQQTVVRKSAELFDQVFTISEFSRSDFISFYGFGKQMKVIHLATNVHPGLTAGAPQEYVLVVGNHFFHKCVDEAIQALDGNWPLFVLGGRSVSGSPLINRLPSGHLTRLQIRQLFWNARAIVYPSLYEGFGLPVLDALAFGKPVVLLDTRVARELAHFAGCENIHWAKSLAELPAAVQHAVTADACPPRQPVRSWRTTAVEYAAAFKRLLDQPIKVKRLRRRWECLRTVQSSEKIADA